MTVTGSREALKPCPFCKGDAQFTVYKEVVFSASWDVSQIQCTGCFARVTTAGADQKTVTERWNTRASPDPAGVTLTVEEIARIIHGVYGVSLGPYAGAHQDKSIERAATAILSLIQHEAAETIERQAREIAAANSSYNLAVGSRLEWRHAAEVQERRALTAEAQRDGALTPDQREAAAKALAAKMLSTEWTDLRPFTRAKYRSAILTMERIIRAAKGAA